MPWIVRQLLLATLITSLTFIVASAGSSADEVETRRVKASLAIFPRIVAVDTHIDRKLDKDGVLHLAIVYVNERDTAAEQAAKLIKAVPNIAGRTLHAHPVALSELASEKQEPVGGIFLTEKLSDSQLRDAVTFATGRHVIVFSPFAGDVERGATAGIAVGSQIKPYFNMRTLRDSEVEINPLLLRISKKYE